MPLLTEKQREEFLSQDRARIYHLANGASEARATKLVTSMSRYQVRQHSAEYSEEQSSTEDGDGDDDDDDVKDDDVKDDEEEGKSDLYESERDPVNLPESTHTLFFTHPVCSVPFGFATAIVVISIGCLVLAFSDNFSSGSNPGNRFGIPANVDFQVRVAQYLAIVIALLMEEEIPTGAYLLRMIPSSAFQKKFPGRSYKRFVASALLRVVLGYIFLLNVLLILIKATGVLEIFYDVLALQFISELDDIAFSLSKLDILGKSLRRACTARLFQTEFERKKSAAARSFQAILFLKSVYFINLALFVSPMIMVSRRQSAGHYQCKRIKVDFGDAVWGDALVRLPEGGYDERMLAFSTFNGVYEKSRTENNRPVYEERRKFDRLEYGDDAGKVPAEIKYSLDLGAWIFYHPLIAKKKQEESEPWLLRSPETDEFDLLNVVGEWSIWFGVIDTTHLSYSCTKCNTDTDCNLNGLCVDGDCECNVEEETSYLGPHCEVKLKDKCASIFDGAMNMTWSIFKYSQVPGGPPDTLFEEYNRPVYVNTWGIEYREGDMHWLLYTGSRWKYVGFNYLDLNITFEEVMFGIDNYHAFWDKAHSYDPYGLNIISGPTKGDTPVGVDWFMITDWGDQFGPFGALTPMQEEIGMGIFSCAGDFVMTEDVADDLKLIDSMEYTEVGDSDENVGERKLESQ
eukprot:CAMPEP_0196159518 /NCGR_PEP_ID=MMETSP0910-20130528/46361_1 /TAXON_ID=49265 /ORGANISM="Thalassiosira rotula, Strain GSO102" /LENGTH=684 /DNA_ID=CAMNT_0041424439 /DNA_START=132 /DNA_END=2186 /DNA_ORIENTATION=+